MIAVDTNVLVRVLVDDPGQPAQIKAARTRVRHAKEVFVPQIVQAETVWVLESAYGLNKPAILDVLEHLLHNKAFVLQDDAIFQKALAAYRIGNADFADYLILAECQSADYELVTFDKRLAKAPGVTPIQP
ncbi:MAG: PIN domain-containing protein [Chloroflexi bacterium RBG_16_52_11]|nr:MAG: PIN domain-containing protein [Chloroflexi bacterium RBG_16_52_11]